MSKYFRLVENSNEEGEQWNFYIPYDEKYENEMIELLKKIKFDNSEYWFIDKYCISENIVDILVEYDNLPCYSFVSVQNKIKEKVTIEQMRNFTSCEHCLRRCENDELEWFKGKFSFKCSDILN